MDGITSTGLRITFDMQYDQPAFEELLLSADAVSIDHHARRMPGIEMTE